MTATPLRRPVLDEEEARLARARRIERIGKWAMPALMLALALFAWDRLSCGTRSRNTSCRGRVWSSKR